MALRQYHKLQLAARAMLASSCRTTGSSAIVQCSSSLPGTWLGSMPVSASHFAAGPLPLGRSAYHVFAGLELPSRQGLFWELPVVSEMLPNRKLIAAQFSPHGLTLVPRSILAPPERAAAPSMPAVAVVQEPTNPSQQAPMHAIGIKTWRRLKMKKHKIKKRRKATRMQVK